MKLYVVILACLCFYFHEVEGNCEVSGRLYDRGEKFFPAHCTQKCVCRRNGRFECVPLCRSKKRACKEGTQSITKQITVKGTNCTCNVYRCKKIKVKPTKIPKVSKKANKGKKNNPTTAVIPKQPSQDKPHNPQDEAQHDIDLKEDNRIQVHLIVAGALAAIFVIFIVAITVWSCRKRKNCCACKGAGGKDDETRKWSMVNRPLPKVPVGESGINQDPVHVPSVPNPYFTKPSSHTTANPNAGCNYVFPTDDCDLEKPSSQQGQYQQLETARTEYEEAVPYIEPIPYLEFEGEDKEEYLKFKDTIKPHLV